MDPTNPSLTSNELLVMMATYLTHLVVLGFIAINPSSTLTSTDQTALSAGILVLLTACSKFFLAHVLSRHVQANAHAVLIAQANAKTLEARAALLEAQRPVVAARTVRVPK